MIASSQPGSHIGRKLQRIQRRIHKQGTRTRPGKTTHFCVVDGMRGFHNDGRAYEIWCVAYCVTPSEGEGSMKKATKKKHTPEG